MAVLAARGASPQLFDRRAGGMTTLFLPRVPPVFSVAPPWRLAGLGASVSWHHGSLGRLALLLSLLLVASGCRGGADQWGPFRGQVVDAETGQTVSGAHVMVLWVREPPSLHATERLYDAQETVTDADGRFELARQQRLFTAFVSGPEVAVFAPGYMMQAPEVTPAGGRAYVDPTVIPMRPLNTRDERCTHIWGGPLVDVGSTVPTFMEAIRQYAADLDCRWPEGQ